MHSFPIRGSIAPHVTDSPDPLIRPWVRLLGAIVAETVKDARRGDGEALSILLEWGISPAQIHAVDRLLLIRPKTMNPEG